MQTEWRDIAEAYRTLADYREYLRANSGWLSAAGSGHSNESWVRSSRRHSNQLPHRCSGVRTAEGAH